MPYTHLARGLQFYYRKDRMHIVFINQYSLQEMAMAMWQDLGYSKIDVSVLSRALSGVRLFTPQQLFVFCKILQLHPEETEHLFHCLTQDYWQRDGVWIEQPFIPTSEVSNLLDSYLKEAGKIHDQHCATTTVIAFLEHIGKYQSKVPSSQP